MGCVVVDGRSATDSATAGRGAASFSVTAGHRRRPSGPLRPRGRDVAVGGAGREATRLPRSSDRLRSPGLAPGPGDRSVCVLVVESLLYRITHQLHPVVQLELPQGVLNMVLHCPVREEQTPGDLLVGKSLGGLTQQ